MTTPIAKVLGMLLKMIYTVTQNYGLAIIFFTIIVKLAMLPLTLSQNKSMMEMNKIQPLIQDIQKKYPKDKQKQAELTTQLYKEHSVNPMMGCLPLLVQMPILFALFRALRNPVEYVFGSETLFQVADTSFLWLKNLSSPDIITIGGFAFPFIFPIVAAAATFIDTKMTMLKNDKKKEKQKDGKQNQPENPGESMQKTMLYMMPLMIFWWGRSFPAGLSIYWAVSTLFSIAQRKIVERISLSKEKGTQAIERRK